MYTDVSIFFLKFMFSVVAINIFQNNNKAHFHAATSELKEFWKKKIQKAVKHIH